MDLDRADAPNYDFETAPNAADLAACGASCGGPYHDDSKSGARGSGRARRFSVAFTP